MNSFEYAAPKNLKEATALLGEKWGEVEILAGGTDLVSSLKQHIVQPKRVVSLKNISDLRGIKAGKGVIRIVQQARQLRHRRHTVRFQHLEASDPKLLRPLGLRLF